MPNPNADQLYELLRKLRPDGVASWQLDDLADELAAQGVLVVSDAVLTDEACMKIHQAGNGAYMFRPDAQRAVLAQLAKGE